MLNIHELMKGLSERRPIFHSEADFQHALAWHIKELNPRSHIRLEIKPFPEKSNRMHLDIWVPSEGTAIELKFLTRHLGFQHGDEAYLLSNQQSTQGCYDFVKDIGRIERIVTDRIDADRGFAVHLTNDSRYWRPTSSIWETNNDAQFRIHEGIVLTGTRSWRSGSSWKNREDSIELRGEYTMQWCDYSKFGSQKNSRFRYLAIEVRK